MKPVFKPAILAGLLCLLAGPVLGGGPVPATNHGRAPSLPESQLKIIPADVEALIERRSTCDRWSNMEIIDEAIDNRVQHALSHLKCNALAIDVAALRLKYAQSPNVLWARDSAGGIGL